MCKQECGCAQAGPPLRCLPPKSHASLQSHASSQGICRNRKQSEAHSRVWSDVRALSERSVGTLITWLLLYIAPGTQSTTPTLRLSAYRGKISFSESARQTACCPDLQVLFYHTACPCLVPSQLRSSSAEVHGLCIVQLTQPACLPACCRRLQSRCHGPATNRIKTGRI